MKELKDFAPSFETCGLLREAGYDRRTLLSWVETSSGARYVTRTCDIPLNGQYEGTFTHRPASTLQELLELLRERDDVWCPTVHSSAYRGWAASCRLVVQGRCRRAGADLKATGDTPVEAAARLYLEVVRRARENER